MLRSIVLVVALSAGTALAEPPAAPAQTAQDEYQAEASTNAAEVRRQRRQDRNCPNEATGLRSEGGASQLRSEAANARATNSAAAAALSAVGSGQVEGQATVTADAASGYIPQSTLEERRRIEAAQRQLEEQVRDGFVEPTQPPSAQGVEAIQPQLTRERPIPAVTLAPIC
jgi:hypothetical protein